MTINKKRILKFLEAMDWMFSLQNFTTELIFIKNQKGQQTAEVFYDEKYQNIIIKIYPDFLEEEFINQRKILLHELCHSITLPSKTIFYDFIDGKAITKEQITEINEKATSQIENLLDSLLRNRLLYAKKAYADYIKPKVKSKKCKKLSIKHK